MQNFLIPAERSVIVSLDVETEFLAAGVGRALRGVPGIGGFKTGMLAGFCADEVRTAYRGETVLIYDHQKGGTDIPEIGPKFALKLKETGFDAAILFPLAGPETQRRWTEACLEVGLKVIVGGAMTHEKFLVSEGGYIADDAPERIFDLACDMGVVDYVVPGTKIEWVRRLRALLERRLGLGNFALYAPGFVTQGGDISECGREAGPRFHPIVGRAIYDKFTKEARRAAALRATKALGL